MFIYTIYDRKASYCLPVFSLKSEADARRQFSEIITQSDTLVSKYPGDYDLVCIAEFDEQTGNVIPYSPTETVINGLTALQAAQHEREQYQKALKRSEPELPFPGTTDAT